MTFQSTWSNATHGPSAFPGGAHLSPLVGNTHDSSISFWASGSLASQGIENMAEQGAVGTLNSETQTAINAGSAYSFISGPGLEAPDTVYAVFSINSTHPLVTLVTMVAPSPDWFVGVSALEFYQGGAWLDDVVVDLYVYDAGTDSGVDFTSPNSDTNPAEPIALLGAPFAGKPKLGTFTFELATDCNDQIDNDGDSFVDLLDPGCSDADDASELSSIACDDCVDNDGDMLVDYPEDDGCTNPLDPSEIGQSAIPALTVGARAILVLGLAGARQVVAEPSRALRKFVNGPLRSAHSRVLSLAFRLPLIVASRCRMSVPGSHGRQFASFRNRDTGRRSANVRDIE